MAKGGTQIPPEQQEFVLLAIEALRTDGKLGIHTVFSGFNEAFRKHFEGLDPIKVVMALETAGVVKTRPSKAGYMLYKAGEYPSKQGRKADEALAKILLRIPANV